MTTECSLRLPVHENRTDFKHNDLLVPWKKKEGDESFHRYYHVFEEGELENLLKSALTKTSFVIESMYYDQGNWCAIFKK